MNEKTSEMPKWHNIPIAEIKWFPTVDPEMCIGCGLCVLGCGRKVFKFDFEEKKSIVIATLKCKVGCITCANTCPAFAISFPSLSYLHKIIKTKKVISTSRNELKSINK
ncbi:MAG: 4Fe-4S dicluster domain-containing protein [Promethearchaeota archaeon]